MNDIQNSKHYVSIKVVGVGGGGGNAVNRMIRSEIPGAEFIAMNTDRQALIKSLAPVRIQLGANLTNGCGAGSDPKVGQCAAEECIEEIKTALKGAQLCFITAGMGGGTGTGAAPVIARVAKEMGILTIGVVTKPFVFEGKRRMRQAECGISAMKMNVDALVVVSNEKLKTLSEKKLTLANAFASADDVLNKSVGSIASLINTPSFINLDIADICSIIKDSGFCCIGIGVGKGENKSVDAAVSAIQNPLCENNICGAHSMIINITAGDDIGLEEVEDAACIVSQNAQPDANIIWGATLDRELHDELWVTVIATGFDETAASKVKLNLENKIPQKELPATNKESRPEQGDVNSFSNSVFDDLLSAIEATPETERQGNKPVADTDTEYITDLLGWIEDSVGA